MSLPSDSTSFTTPTKLVAAFRQLPTVAQVLARLQRLLADPNSGLDDIADMIRLDAALASRLIQISNSVWFKRGLPCTTISEAVNRVGYREVYRLVGVVASGSMVAEPLPAYGRDVLMIWHESVACAFAAEILAERLGEDMPGAYMCGLLHSIGRMPINQYMLTLPEPLKPFAEEPFPDDHSGAEYSFLGFNHAEVGALMLAKWEFTPSTFQPIRYQYTPLEAEEPYDLTSAVLYGARLLRSVVCQNLAPEAMKVDEDILATLRLTPDDVFSHLPKLRDQLHRAFLMTK